VDLKNSVPLVVYDNTCYLCIKFAKIVNFLGGKKIRLVGHYSDFGETLRNKLLDSHATEMFWFIDRNMAYGGRAALIPLILSILKAKKTRENQETIEESCDVKCKAPKAVFLRSYSLFSNSKKIRLNQ